MGPIGHGCLEDMTLDANVTADIGLDIVHSYQFNYTNLKITNWASIGVRSMAVDYVFPLMVNGNNANVFKSVQVWSQYGGATARGGQFGQSAANVNNIYDFASNIFMNSNFRHDTGYGIELRFADANTFIMTNIQGGVASVLFTNVPTTGFPQSNVFYNCHFIGQVSASPATFKPTIKNVFLPLGEEGTQDINIMGNFSYGIAHSGEYFGKPKNIPLRETVKDASSDIFNTTTDTQFDRTYTIPAYALDEEGAVVRIRASGLYSSTATPTLQLAIKFNSSSIAVIAPIAVFNNAASLGWTLEGDVIIKTIGAGGTARSGFSRGGIQAIAAQDSTWSNSFSVNTTTTNTVSVYGKWGTANASNQVNLQNMTVEILYPGHVN